MSTAWTLQHHRGSASDFHRRELPGSFDRSLWWFEVERPAVVLGSTQPLHTADQAAAAAAGVEVVRRRSGGGAVWLAPGEVTWVDVLLPAGDPLWHDDVGVATHWLGAIWQRVVARLGAPQAVIHTGPLVTTTWSRLVCFGGAGPGEVFLGDGKVVGISQRRARPGARFQCALLHRWDPAPLLANLVLSEEQRRAAAADLAGRGAALAGVSSAQVVAALQEELALLG